MFSVPRILLPVCLLSLLIAAYSNHFHNSFHFDDFHTIQQNIHLRSLNNIGKFFTDSRTFSNLPTHQVYRPLLTTSLAVDYVLGGGQPFAFHVTTFVFYIVYLATVFALFLHLMNAAMPHQANWMTALLGAAIYGLHPVCAETINYIVQRADLFSTLGVTAGVVLYARMPRWRRYGAYLVPVVLALLSKPPTLIFPVILFAYVYLFESRNFGKALRATAPSLAVCAVIAALLSSMTAASFNPGGTPAPLYRMTQMFVALYYFGAFFAPIHLNADTDWRVVSGIADPRALAGLAFLIALGAAIWFTQRRRETRPIAFGLVWFVAALLPTSWMPLAEVANDHRMFFPFTGLTLAIVWTVRLLIPRWTSSRGGRAALAAAACLLLVVEARATHARNEVWRNEETLWYDVTLKSPTNGRGLMNYALTQMAKGDLARALQYLERARVYTPAYFLLEINLGIAKSEVGRHKEAEPHFLRAIDLQPRRYESQFYYARWLQGRGRLPEAAQRLEAAVQFNPYALDARHLLMQVYAAQRNWQPLEALAAETLTLVPGDPEAQRFAGERKRAETELLQAESAARDSPSPENYLNLSLVYYRASKFEDSIRAAKEALRLRPAYAEAYNNIAAGHIAQRRWQEGIRAADEALRLKPEFHLARNNRAWALAQLAKEPR